MLVKYHGKFCVGDNVTLADFFLIPQTAVFDRLPLKYEDYPTLAAIKANIEELPEFKATLPHLLPDAEPLP